MAGIRTPALSWDSGSSSLPTQPLLVLSSTRAPTAPGQTPGVSAQQPLHLPLAPQPELGPCPSAHRLEGPHRGPAQPAAASHPGSVLQPPTAVPEVQMGKLRLARQRACLAGPDDSRAAVITRGCCEVHASYAPGCVAPAAGPCAGRAEAAAHGHSQRCGLREGWGGGRVREGLRV